MESESSESVTGKFASQQELKLKEFLDGELKYVQDLEKIVAILEDILLLKSKVKHRICLTLEAGLQNCSLSWSWKSETLSKYKRPRFVALRTERSKNSI